MTAYRMISAERARTPVSVACRLLGVSRSGFYDWERSAPSDRVLTDAWLIERIHVIHERSRGTYGSPRVHAELRRRGIGVGRKRVERLMRQADLEGAHRRRRRGTTVRVPGVRAADDLVARQFSPAAPDMLWVADIKQIQTGEGRLYVAAVQDAFSRRIVGWSMADHMRAELVVDALQMAVARRRAVAGVVHHSDQGSQYVSLAFGQTCAQAGIAKSMGSRGDCFDNAVAERFFATLSKELLYRQAQWPTRAALRSAIFDYIETFYNRERLHSTLGMRPPAEYEHAFTARTATRAGASVREKPENLFTTLRVANRHDDDDNPELSRP